MEQHIFPYRGKTFIHTPGSLTTRDTIEVQYPGNPNRYVDEITRIGCIDKIDNLVEIIYRSYLYDVNGDIISDRAGKVFNAASQETMGYFYNMVSGQSLGKSLDQMTIDGWLIANHDLPYGVYGDDGNFYYPIWFDYTSTPTVTTVVDADGTVTEITKYELTITVQDKLVDEVYTYTVLNSTIPSNTTGVFFDLDADTYTILVESPRSMPCLRTIQLS